MFVLDHRIGENTEVTNCIIKGFGDYRIGTTAWGGTQQDPDIDFVNCCFDNELGFDASADEISGNIHVDPAFDSSLVTAAGEHFNSVFPAQVPAYRIQDVAGIDCVDTGTSTLLSVSIDIFNNSRPQRSAMDIGAHELED